MWKEFQGSKYGFGSENVKNWNFSGIVRGQTEPKKTSFESFYDTLIDLYQLFAKVRQLKQHQKGVTLVLGIKI